MKCLTLLAILISCFQWKVGKHKVKNLKNSISVFSLSLLLLANCRWSTEATKQIVCVPWHWITECSKLHQHWNVSAHCCQQVIYPSYHNLCWPYILSIILLKHPQLNLIQSLSLDAEFTRFHILPTVDTFCHHWLLEIFSPLNSRLTNFPGSLPT